MITRREFLLGSVAAPLLLRVPSPIALFRIGTLLPAGENDLSLGVSFGLSEAERSATLFGAHVAGVALEESGLVALGAQVDALLVGIPRRISTTPPPALRMIQDSYDSGDVAFDLVPPTRVVERLLARLDPGTRERRVDVWHPSLEKFGAAQLNDRFRAATGRPMSADAWLGWFGVKLLADAWLRVRSPNAERFRSFLSGATAQFDGHKGAPLRFGSDRVLRQPLYVVARRADAWELAAEVPAEAVDWR